MARYSVRDTKWMIFIDGVQVPFQTFTVDVGVDFAGKATIAIEHDPLLRELRPRSLVHIFMWDEFEEANYDSSGEEADKKGFKLFWEGDLESFTDSRTPSARQFILEAVGLFTVFARHRLFLTGTGKLPVMHLTSGSTLLKRVAAYPRQLLSYSLFGDLFATVKDKGIPAKDIGIGGGQDIVYAERLIKLITFFSSYNASLRLQTVRTNLLGKIASIEDKTLSYMIPRSLVASYMTQANSEIPDEATVLDLFNLFNKYAYHRYVSTVGPHLACAKNEDDDRLIEPAGMSKDKANVFAIPKLFDRNDYLILPETFYAIPPSCNIIFPEFIESFNIGRRFSSEPTRAVMVDTHMKSKLVVVAPYKIFRYGTKDMQPGEFWSINRAGTYAEQEAGETESAYLSPAGKDKTNISLLAAMSDREIEKGILPITSYPAFEYFSGLATAFDMKNQDTIDQIKGILRDSPDLDALVGEGNEGKKYIHVLQTLAEYNLTLAKFTRQADIVLTGHRWMVPGLPAPILTTGGSYIGWIRQLSFTVDVEGQETTAVGLDYVRPIPKADYGLAREAEEIIGKQLALEGLGKDIIKSYQAVIDSFDSLNNKIQPALNALYRMVTGGASGTATGEEWSRNVAIVETSLTDMRKRVQGLAEYFSQSDRLRVEDASTIPIDLTILAEKRSSTSKETPIKFSPPTSLKPVILIAANISYVMTSTTEKWARAQIDEVNKAVSERRVPDVSDAVRPPIRQKLAQYKGVLNQIRGGLAALPEQPSKKALDASATIRDNFPFPPIFANPDLIEIKEAEKLYEKLLGAQKVFTEYAEESQFLAIPSVSKKSVGGLYVAIENRRAYSRFLDFIQALGKIFPISGDLTGSTVWEQKSEASENQEAVRDWEERDILRRPTMQSLGQFLDGNSLDLTVEVSDLPTPTKFYRMVPSKGITHEMKNDDGKTLTWDDSLFSKIIDEYNLVPRTIVVNGRPDFKRSDDEIDRLRRSVQDPMLTTKARQEIILAYSRQHFGSRGFDAT